MIPTANLTPAISDLQPRANSSSLGQTTNCLHPASEQMSDPMTPFRHLRASRSIPPGETGQESLYLRSLSERHVQVAVLLRDGENVSGWIEYFDDGMIRLTREHQPNLFIYKHQIRSITEAAHRRPTTHLGQTSEQP